MMAAYLNGSTVNSEATTASRAATTGAYITEDFLRILGVSPAQGPRLRRPRTTFQGAEKVALIGYGTWQRDFGGSANIIGTAVRINGKPATIIGVMPQGICLSAERRNLAAALRRFPAEAAQRSKYQ